MKPLAFLLAVLLLPAATAGAKPLRVRSGSTAITFDKRFGLALVQKGVDAFPVAPAVQDSLTFAVPMTGGTVQGRAATFEHDGGFRMFSDSMDVELSVSKLRLRVIGRRVLLSGFAVLDGLPIDAFAFANGRATKPVRSRGRYRIRRVPLTLNDVGASALNGLFATTEFSVGEYVGTASVDSRLRRSS